MCLPVRGDRLSPTSLKYLMCRWYRLARPVPEIRSVQAAPIRLICRVGRTFPGFQGSQVVQGSQAVLGALTGRWVPRGRPGR